MAPQWKALAVLTETQIQFLEHGVAHNNLQLRLHGKHAGRQHADVQEWKNLEREWEKHKFKFTLSY